MPPVVLVPERRTVILDERPFSPEPDTPLSVRPFSPSERWSFPKPPHDDRPPSALYPILVAPSPDSFGTSEYITAPESIDPFADPDASGADSGTVETTATSDTTAAHFAPIETISRPYVPTRGDEVAVNAGDSVRVFRRFDDGWAYAENCNTGRRGLFPIDCLRQADQDLPTFLAAKRLSSYARPPSSAAPRLPAVEEHYDA